MSVTLKAIIPDAETLLDLAPEELAGTLLVVIRSQADEHHGTVSRHNFCLSNHGYDSVDRKTINHAVLEAWGWLEREGFIALDPAPGPGWFFITRRGKSIKEPTDLDAYRKANLLPKEQLHPVIALKTWSPFIRGEYDTAVFQAFKEVEVAVRKAGGFKDTDYGVPLMRTAFHADKGPLTDKALPKPEREALASLFAGAIGSYKNPHSHRTVSIADPVEAVEMIVLASHLMRIVEARQQTTGTT